jgi:hypothetical protein
VVIDQPVMRSSKPSRIRSLLENSEASRLISRARALGQLDALVHELIPPPLNQHCRVLALRDDTLIIAADSAVWAARLRYQSPQLTRQLASVSTLNLRTVQVRVRGADPVPVTRATTAKQSVSNGNSLALKRTARNITDARLKSALLRLAGRRTSAVR